MKKMILLSLAIFTACAGRNVKDEAVNLLHQGGAFYAQGQFSKALPLLLKAHQKDPQLSTACFYLGNIYSHHKLPDEALRYYHLGLKTTQAPARFHFNIGLTRIQKGKYNAALHSLSRALTLDPSLGNAHLDMGLAYYQLKNLKGAIKQWRLYLLKVPDAPQREALRKGIRILERKTGR